ncbi:MAG: hypothetical protein UV95_C0001G0264 [Candidatus Falkowbacteria bacterium GW2011_GWF2_43_32]|nr:MAG: hypothetical protein UV95_C0001G0264 [Candidatus Falkowbacteria bacterium GW2011_GWF2_43_32]
MEIFILILKVLVFITGILCLYFSFKKKSKKSSLAWAIAAVFILMSLMFM